MARVAVVTGSNKGIGFEIVKRLCQQFDGHVYLTARDPAKVQSAVSKLEAEGMHPKYYQLDVTSQDSVEKLKGHLVQTYGGIDVLVNNAGIMYNSRSSLPPIEQASLTIATNFTGTLRLTKALLPLTRPHARIVNVSSIMGGLKSFRGRSLLDKFTNPNLTEEELVELMDQFVDDVKEGRHKEKGWPQNSYGGSVVGTSAYMVSKAGVIALTKVYAREAAKLGKDDVLVNACCPGWCQTDMSSGSKAPFTAAQGAETPVHLALLPPGSPTGEFWRDKTVAVW
eukprot:Em0003g802a